MADTDTPAPDPSDYADAVANAVADKEQRFGNPEGQDVDRQIFSGYREASDPSSPERQSVYGQMGISAQRAREILQNARETLANSQIAPPGYAEQAYSQGIGDFARENHLGGPGISAGDASDSYMNAQVKLLAAQQARNTQLTDYDKEINNLDSPVIQAKLAQLMKRQEDYAKMMTPAIRGINTPIQMQKTGADSANKPTPDYKNWLSAFGTMDKKDPRYLPFDTYLRGIKSLPPPDTAGPLAPQDQDGIPVSSISPFSGLAMKDVDKTRLAYQKETNAQLSSPQALKWQDAARQRETVAREMLGIMQSGKVNFNQMLQAWNGSKGVINNFAQGINKFNSPDTQEFSKKAIQLAGLDMSSMSGSRGGYAMMQLMMNAAPNAYMLPKAAGPLLVDEVKHARMLQDYPNFLRDYQGKNGHTQDADVAWARYMHSGRDPTTPRGDYRSFFKDEAATLSGQAPAVTPQAQPAQGFAKGGRVKKPGYAEGGVPDTGQNLEAPSWRDDLAQLGNHASQLMDSIGTTLAPGYNYLGARTDAAVQPGSYEKHLQDLRDSEHDFSEVHPNWDTAGHLIGALAPGMQKVGGIAAKGAEAIAPDIMSWLTKKAAEHPYVANAAGAGGNGMLFGATNSDPGASALGGGESGGGWGGAFSVPLTALQRIAARYGGVGQIAGRLAGMRDVGEDTGDRVLAEALAEDRMNRGLNVEGQAAQLRGRAEAPNALEASNPLSPSNKLAGARVTSNSPNAPTLADVGDEGVQAVTRAAMRHPGPQQTDFLSDMVARQTNAPRTASGMLFHGTGVDPYFESAAGNATAAKAASNTAYKAAFEQL